ncbi:MAG: hypothetical protein ACRENU_14930 [Gemmatimonadaceae bacterium]
MVDRSKALVSRAALERVLARAAELQGSSDGDTPDTLTEAQVQELGKEVGLSPEHIRQALAEERVRVEPLNIGGSGLAYDLFGPDALAAQRVVRGKPERVLAAIDRWMQKEEGLKVKRQRPEFITWEPMRGVFGSLRRMLGTGDFALTRADEVTASAGAVDDEFALVRFQASFQGHRSAMGSRTAGGSIFGVAATGTLVGLALIVTHPVAPLVWIPITMLPTVLAGGGSYYSARRSHHNALQRAQLALEQILDRLERGDAERPSLLKMIESALPPTR